MESQKSKIGDSRVKGIEKSNSQEQQQQNRKKKLQRNTYKYGSIENSDKIL